MILGIQRFLTIIDKIDIGIEIICLHNIKNHYIFASQMREKTSRKNKNKNLIKLEYYGNKIL